ncbi:BadF/BadG/BcrA/BcrD ATPase family protein [Agromyces sp. G08B096]|uniref:BadF/BadG/BcrA/BcrD ATPase family protein n=1 Tax=Agromyces sp. G08B096 TaxID=3156399 RepID=A0AAU7WAB3_9MICO
MSLLGIDIGGSGSRVAVLPLGGGPRLELAGERAGVTAEGSSVPATALALVRAARAAWPAETARIEGVGLGATGLGTLVADPAALATELGAELASDRGSGADASRPTFAGTDASPSPQPSGSRPRVAVAIDAVTAHLGALAGRPGAIVALGTGAIAFGTDGADIWRRVDGWGHLLGDRGGGAWIGLRGLETAMRAHDGVDTAGTALLAAAVARFGEPMTWPAQLYTRHDRAGVLASFAPDVTAVAADGDAAATAILTDAGTEAARSGIAALAPGLPPRIAATGGLLAAGGPLVAAFRDTIVGAWPDVELVEPAGDPLDGALRLAELAAAGGIRTHAPYVWTAEAVA